MRLLLIIVFSVISAMLSAQDLSLFERHVFVSGNDTLRYRLLYPENYNPEKKYPVILFLHGAGERGNNNEAQLVHGGTMFINAENRKNFPCFVVAPQCPAEQYWSSVQIDRSKLPLKLTFDYNRNITRPLEMAMTLLNNIIEEKSADKERIYIAGLSMGGMGTFEAVYHYPKLFAAAMPICGGGDASMYDRRVKKTSFWVFHGAKDAVVDVSLSREMVAKLKALKIDCKYTEYPEVNHNSWDNAFIEPEFFSWLFSQKR